MAIYTYRLLPHQTNHIRVVTIQPGIEDDDIVIALDVIPFSLEEPPNYEALSYTWGSPENPATIEVLSFQKPTVEGDSEKLTMPVTQNLHVALKNLRLVNVPRVMWIDALCIDQNNNEEKGREVQRMNHIYRLARRVVVWLGPASDESDRTMRMMERIANMLEVDWIFKNVRLINAENLKGNIALPFDLQDLTGYYHLICRPWFERLWIRQEITLANSTAIVCCGHESLLWKTFRKALVGVHAIFIEALPGVQSCLLAGPELREELGKRGSRLSRFFWQDARVYLSDSKNLFAGSDCFDPRDRIYAIIHLLEEQLDLAPNYTLTVWQVYEDAVVRYLAQRRFDFLQMSQLQVPTQLGPTWVPDWSTPSPGEQGCARYMTHASSQLAAWYRHPSAGTLSVAGVKVLTIDHIQPEQVTRNDARETFQQIRQILNGLVSRGALSNVDADHEIVARTFLCCKFLDSEIPHNVNFATLNDAKRIVSSIMSPGHTFRAQDYPAGSSGRTTISRMWNFLTGAHVFTAGNVIGLARGPVQPGDQVYVLVGCTHSVVLRKVPGTSENNFQHVGECFVRHVSQGQALLGPLPENIEHIVADLEGNARNYRDTFINRLTGGVSKVDPRLATSLPPELVTRFQEWIKHDPDNRILVDPELLRRPGIDIEYLNLV